MKTMLVLNVPPVLEEDLVDYLLGHPDIDGFTSFAAAGHGAAGSALSIAEQVTGRRKRVQFEIIMASDRVDQVTDNLAVEVGPDIVYWHVPITGLGRS